jgi:hypothetical protein
MVLGFFELQKEDVPPERYWHSGKHIEAWFEAVEQRRKDTKDGFVPIESPDMMENELAKGLRG